MAYSLKMFCMSLKSFRYLDTSRTNCLSNLLSIDSRFPCSNTLSTEFELLIIGMTGMMNSKNLVRSVLTKMSSRMA